MTTYAAFIRGIMPMNPNMRNKKLKAEFESLGFSNVKTVIASGNVIFESESRDKTMMENMIGTTLQKNLGFKGTTFIRSKKDLEKIIKKDPFKGTVHSRQSYLIVTFLKKKPFEIFTATNVAEEKTPNFMSQIEKEYGKEITTRTWKTVERMVAKMKNS